MVRQALGALALGLVVALAEVAVAAVPAPEVVPTVTPVAESTATPTAPAAPAVIPAPAVTPVSAPAPGPAVVDVAPGGDVAPVVAVEGPLAPPAPPPVPVVQPEGPLSVEISARLAMGLAGLDSRRPLDGARLKLFYEQRHFASAWFTGEDATDLIKAAAQVREVAGAASQEGLLPADYHLAALDQRLPLVGKFDPAQRAELDVLLTDALMAYAVDVHRGRLPPRVIAGEFALVPAPMDVQATALAALAAPDMAAFLVKLAPAGERYRRLREALRATRALAQAGGWPRVPEGPRLVLGMKDPVVKAVRRRLAATGDFGGKVAQAGSDYDSALRAAVARFQQRHGLPADGVLNSATYAELNVGVAARITALLANMERERWMPDDLGPRYILVNIPGFSLAVVNEGKVVLEMPVIVGTKVRRTPIFASTVSSLIWNPTWSVPRKLAREDILPKLRADPGYLASHNIVLYDGSFAGRRVDPARINWQAVGDISQFRLRQRPGAHNALGQVKFNIINDFDVYLHDTPHREKFVKAVRTFSSGCVRVGNPLGLAELLLSDMPEWTAERRKLVLEKGDTRLVELRTPMPVFLLYQTAWVDGTGALQFREDIYGRDVQILRALHRIEEPVREPVSPAAEPLLRRSVETRKQPRG